jgi:hypothetical protein
LRNASVPYFWSFLHIPTLSLAFFEGRLKISSSQGAEFNVIFITSTCYNLFVTFGITTAIAVIGYSWSS